MARKMGSLVEVILFYAVVHFVIWGSVIWRPPVLLTAVILVGICVFSNRRHKDTLERIGLARKNFWPTVKMISPLAILLFIPILVLAWNKEFSKGWDFWFAILGYPVWAFAQDYALLGFVGNRLEDVWPGKTIGLSVINAFLFGLTHLPNPVLTPITFLAGFIFTYVFLRSRHLIPIALVHALFGVALSFAMGDLPRMMSVGPAYLTR